MFYITIANHYANVVRFNTSIIPKATMIDVIDSLEIWMSVYSNIPSEYWVHDDSGRELYHTVCD